MKRLLILFLICFFALGLTFKRGPEAPAFSRQFIFATTSAAAGNLTDDGSWFCVSLTTDTAVGCATAGANDATTSIVAPVGTIAGEVVCSSKTSTGWAAGDDVSFQIIERDTTTASQPVGNVLTFSHGDTVLAGSFSAVSTLTAGVFGIGVFDETDPGADNVYEFYCNLRVLPGK